MRRRRWILALLALIVVAVAVASMRRAGGAAVDVTAEPARRQAVFRASVTASGEIVATRYADIGSSVMGKIVELNVKEGDTVKAHRPPRRVVSLVPSLTESMFDLGLGHVVGGVTDYCLHPAHQLQSLPRLGDVQNPRLPDILSLKPDLVLASWEDNTRQTVEAPEAAKVPVWVTYPHTVQQSLDVLWALAGIFQSQPASLPLKTLGLTLDWAVSAATERKTQSYFCPLWFEQTSAGLAWWMIFNQHTYCHDLLHLLGGYNVFAERQRRYPLEADLGLAPPEDPGEIARFEADGMQGLIDRRMGQVSSRRAPVDEVLGVQRLYRFGFAGWNVKHFHAWYGREHGGRRSYTWVKNVLQAGQLVVRSKARGKHRQKRERRPLPGILLHQDASSHEWVPGQRWDLVVTMDDATSEHTSMFFCAEEGTDSSFHGIGQTIARHGLFCSLYTDRGSHYFHTPQAGHKVDATHQTQVGRALAQLGIEHIAAYSPEARGRSERAFDTHQGRLPRELARAGISDSGRGQ